MFKTYKWSEIDGIAFELLNKKCAIMPTDTVIGILSKDPNLIYDIKQRSHDKKIILFIIDDSVLGELTQIQKSFLAKFWPGPITVIKNNVSYRIPNDKYILYLLNKVGPLYSSSANISGFNTIKNTIEANDIFDCKKYFYKLILVEGEQKSDTPSTIVNIDNWKIIREGAMKEEVKQFIHDSLSVYKNFCFMDQSIYKDKLKQISKLLPNNFNFYVLNSENINNIINEYYDLINQKIIIITNDSQYWDLYLNKIKFFKSGIVYKNEIANLIKQHNNVNVAIFDLDLFDINTIIKQIKAYLNSNFEGGRHLGRINEIEEYEKLEE